MADMSDYLANALRDHIFRTASFAKPTALYVALYTDANGTVEVAGGNYARAQLDPDDANWGAPATGQAENTPDIVFPAPNDDWGKIQSIAVCDASSGGNQLFVKALDTPKTVNNGDPAPRFSSGDLDITFS